MDVTTQLGFLVAKLCIPEARRRALWERAERMRVGVDSARGIRAALADHRARRASGGLA